MSLSQVVEQSMVKFRPKLSAEDTRMLKMVCAVDNRPIYKVAGDSIAWGRANQTEILALAYPRNGVFRSCYVEDINADLNDLQDIWDCNQNVAFYTCLVMYLRSRVRATDGGEVNGLITTKRT